MAAFHADISRGIEASLSHAAQKRAKFHTSPKRKHAQRQEAMHDAEQEAKDFAAA